MRALPVSLGKLSFLLPLLGAGGFITLSEISIPRPHDFLWWSVVNMTWILTV